MLHAAPQAGCRRHDRIITAMPAAELPKAAGGIRDPGLLADHGHAQLAVGIGDELAGQVDGDGMEVAGEREWGGVVGGDGRARVGAAGEPARVESDGGGDGELALGDELPVEVQLGAAGEPFP